MDMKKTAHIVLTSGVLAVGLTTALQANAAGTSITSKASAQTVDVASGAAGGYVVEAFKLNISAHTALTYDGNTTAVGVKTGNSKGMHTFGGSSNGGAVKACQKESIADPAASLGDPTITAGC